MSDLISRSALIEEIKEWGIYGSGYSDAERENDVIDRIESQPTIEAVPVVHGRIIYKIDVPHCSVCGKVIHGESNYCRHCGAMLDLPECGARMKGGADQ